MKRRVPLGVALALASFACVGAAEPAVVLSVHAPSMDWPHARRSVEAELRASGFEVIEQESSALDPGSLLAEVAARTAEHPDTMGSVTVIRVGTTGLAYVWIPAQKRMFRVEAPPAETNVAAAMLSLRVADLLSVRPRAHEPPPTEDEPEAPTEESRVDQRPWLWLGIGPTLAAARTTAGAHMSLGINLVLAEPWSVDVAGAVSLRPTVADLTAGPVSISHQRLGVHMLLRVVSQPFWSVATGLGGAGLCLQAQGRRTRGPRGVETRAASRWLRCVRVWPSTWVRPFSG